MKFITFSWGDWDNYKLDHTLKSIYAYGHEVLRYNFSKCKSAAEARNLALKTGLKYIKLEETFCFMDRDVFIHHIDGIIPEVPFGVIGITGREWSVDKDLNKYTGKRSDIYKIPEGPVDTGKAIHSVLFMTKETLEYIGYYNEDYLYTEDLWGMEDSEWIVRAKMKGCEFVKLTGIDFYHFDHWISDKNEEDNLYRRHNNSVRLFEHKYGFKWKDYCRAQSNAKKFEDKIREDDLEQAFTNGQENILLD